MAMFPWKAEGVAAGACAARAGSEGFSEEEEETRLGRAGSLALDGGGDLEL